MKLENTNNIKISEKLAKKIASTEFVKVGKKTTVCLITLDNGYELVASSSAVEEYNEERGRKYSAKAALEKLADYEQNYVSQRELMFK